QDVFDLLSGLPTEVFLDHTFHTEAIQHAYPRYAAFPFAAKKEQRLLSADHAPLRVFRRDVVSTSLRHGRSSLLRRSYFMPRLMRGLVDPSYCQTIDWLGRSVLYALQLEEISKAAASGPRPASPSERGATPMPEHLLRRA